MKLGKIEIRNFRSIRHLTIHPQQLTTLIGKNSSGKSNVLRALQFFFAASARSAVIEDICKFADDAGTWVECTFANLTDLDSSEVPEKYIRHDGTFCVRRTLTKDGERCVSKWHGHIRTPTEPWLQENYADYADLAKWQKLGVDITAYATLGKSGRPTKDTFKEFRSEYIKQHATEIEFKEHLFDTEFKGRQSTAAKVFPHFIFVPAVGDIVPVIYGKQSSLLNEIVAAVIETGKDHPDYEAAQASLAVAQNLVNPSASRLGTLARIETSLANRLEKSWPGTKVAIRTQIDDLAKILVNGLVLSVNDGHDTDLADKGDGIQRQILFRVFQLYADFRAHRGIFELEEGQPVADRGPNIVAFEEPELFLHPQAQEAFYDDLLTVSESDQVLLATHSNFLIRLENADGLHIIYRKRHDAPTEFRTAEEGWLDANDRQRLKEINLFSGDVSKVFFADRVVITEGQEDIIYIQGTARDYAKCLDRRVTVVEAGGITGIPPLQRVLNAFKIPYIVACDRDPDNSSSEKTRVKIKRLIDDINSTHGEIAGIELFDPDIPTVCRGSTPPPGEKPYVALVYIRDNQPTAQFVERVKLLFDI